MTERETRRQLGVLCKRLPEARFGAITDPRRRQGRRWSLRTLVCSAVVGLIAGRKSLKDVEELTADASGAARSLLGIGGRVPDTTVRNVLVRLEPDEVRQCLHRVVLKAHRRKALAPMGMPFGVVALDGRCTTLNVSGPSPYVQRCKATGGGTHDLLRTVTATLISSRQKVCIDATPIPNGYNEQSHYQCALEHLHKAYGATGMFKMVSYDSGACSRVNARVTREFGLHYLMRINNQPKLRKEAVRRAAELGEANVHAQTEEREQGHTVVRQLWVLDEVASWPRWTGAKALLVRRRIVRDRDGSVLSDKMRCYVTSLPSSELSGARWLRLVRHHWAVENNCHHTFDAVFREDDKPWIVADGRGALVVLLLRRIAYTILALHRCNYAGNAGQRPPWRRLQTVLYIALLKATAKHVNGLRPLTTMSARV